MTSSTEAFILSHGSWQNRWKISVVSGKVRWTLKTSSIIKDVDSSFGLMDNENYHVTATFDGKYALLYIDGKLDGFEVLNGTINVSPFDFLIGQMLPDENAYNYRGVIDEVAIYDYALSPEDVIRNMEGPIITGVLSTVFEYGIKAFPNPTTGKVALVLDNDYDIKSVAVYNMYGQKISIDIDSDDHIGKKYAVDFSNFRNGIYYVNLGGQSSIITIKVIVAK